MGSFRPSPISDFSMELTQVSRTRMEAGNLTFYVSRQLCGSGLVCLHTISFNSSSIDRRFLANAFQSLFGSFWNLLVIGCCVHHRIKHQTRADNHAKIRTLGGPEYFVVFVNGNRRESDNVFRVPTMCVPNAKQNLRRADFLFESCVFVLECLDNFRI